MKTQLVALVTLLGLFMSGAALAQQRVLRGHVLLVEKDDQIRPASGAQVSLFGYGNATRSDSHGLFRLFLPDTLNAGDPITLSIQLKGYRVWSPLEGRTLVPKSLDTQVLEVRLLPAGSKKFLSDEGIERMLRAAMDSNLQQPQEKARPQPPELKRYLAEWATQYGFSAQQVMAEVERWLAEVEKKQDDEGRLAVAAFARNDFQAAARHAGASAERKRQRLEALRQKAKTEEQRLGDEVARDYQLQGASYLNQHVVQLDEALRAYEQAVKYVTKQSDPLLWASIWSNFGLCHEMLGLMDNRAEADTRPHLETAVVAYRRAMEVPIREQAPMLWAVTYSNLGQALLGLAENATGERQTGLRTQAVEAIRLALQVDVRKNSPRLSRDLQKRLGTILFDLSQGTPGKAGLPLLEQSVQALQLAISTPPCDCQRETDAEEQAGLQVHLGTALLQWSSRASDSHEEALLHAEQAEKAFRGALSYSTREREPRKWAAIQHDLGVALMLQGQYTQGEARYPVLARAVDTACLLLTSLPREEPQWVAARQLLPLTLLTYAEGFSGDTSKLPTDLATRARIVEASVLGTYLYGRRPELQPLLERFRSTPRMDVGLRALRITLALSDGDLKTVPGELEALRAVIAEQPPDFKTRWDFSVMRCFIQTQARLDPSRGGLLMLFHALQAEHRDEISQGLHSVRMNFRAH